MTRGRTFSDPAAVAEARRLRCAAADAAAWSLFADDTTALELETAAHDALVAADVLDGALPLGIVL